jgi:hypothetical protein
MLAMNVYHIVTDSKRTHQETSSYINQRFPGINVNSMQDTNSIKCVIVNHLRSVGTPTAFQLLDDLAKINYFF